jgi:predicted 3-demethylubiquinone-9 3-methyltransferase (glyoxalase superfamily)
MPPEPRLQGILGHETDAQQDLRNKVKEDTAANEKLGWIDEKAGIAQIPVKDAMKIIAEKGFPAVTTPPAEKKK